MIPIFHRHPLARVLPAAALVLVATAPGASAATGGGTSFQTPAVTGVECGTGQSDACPRGHTLKLTGTALDSARKVKFLGGKGTRDDRTAKPIQRSAGKIVVRVPRDARSGALKVLTSTDPVTTEPVEILPASSAPAGAAQPIDFEAPGVFPVQGKYKLGTGSASFGGGRGHQGHDVFAKCGTPLVAALSGTVQRNATHGRAGYYLVIDAEDGTSQAYMHLLERSPLKKGDTVLAGDRIGAVGETGRAFGCHLHFEFWTAPGWYKGGEPIDPLPALKRWARGDGARSAGS